MITGIDQSEVKALRNKLIEGTQVKTPVGSATLLHKYKHFAQTDKGNWKWIEVYLAEHGNMCEDRVKLIKEIPKDAGNMERH